MCLLNTLVLPTRHGTLIPKHTKVSSLVKRFESSLTLQMRSFALLLGLAVAQYEIAGFERTRRQVDGEVCRIDADIPVFAESSCTRDCAQCNACVVILIQLGCDIIRELVPMRDSILDVLRQFKQ